MAPLRTILVVDDEPTIASVLARYLQREGYRALTAADGPSAVLAAEASAPDLVVLDVMLPGFDGLNVMARLRRARPVPVILLTARGEEADRLRGLRLGADDYVTKPFSPAELVARVGAVLRRSDRPNDRDSSPIRLGPLVIDGAGRTVSIGGSEVALTAREFELLHFLARHPGRVFSRRELMDLVWRQPYAADTATITVHIRRLRQKLERDPLAPALLQTVWGVGYRLCA